MANIDDLSISYPDFKLNDVIDPEQFDTNNAQIVQKVNEVIDKVNADGADAAVTTARIADNAVTTAKILDANITTSKIADLNVTTAKLNESSVTASKIADANVITSKILDGNITTAKIADANVTTVKIADANITTAKLADNSVTGAKILDGTITNAEIATGTITQDKLVTGTLDNRYYTETETDTKLALKANLASPTFTGNVTVPAPTTDTDASTKKYVDDKDAAQKTYIDTQDGTKVNKSGDTLTGYLTLHANPTNINHATTKDYTDSRDALKVSKSGDTMTGPLTLSGNPTQNLEAAPKQYVDTQDALKVSKSGDTMTGSLVLSGNPTNPLEAAPKQYVDTQISNLISSAPGVLDTLDEIAAALGDDPNFATTMTNQLALKAPLASPALTGTPTAPDPTTTQGIATKNYVDTQNALKAPKVSPTFTGTVTVPSPINATDAVNKDYVDTVDATKAPINSPSFTGTASFSGNVDFNKNQAIEFTFENLASAPLNPIEGQIYYNTVERKYYGYKGAVSGWADLSGKGALIKDKLFTATAGQTAFDLSDVGTYFTGTNAVTVMKLNTTSNTYEIIGEAEYTETSSTVITLTSGLSAGDKIWVRWFENNPEVIAELSAFLKKDGTVAMMANLNLGGYKVTNLATPTTTTDATTKAYVDTADALKVSKSGDTMTGTLNLPVNGLAVGGTQLYCASNGNIGIGSNNPTSKLFLQNSGALSIVLWNVNGTSQYLGFGSDATSHYIGGDGAYPLKFLVNSAEAMRIDTSRNVGIGTTTPNSKLEVAGTTKIQQIKEKINVTASAPTTNIDILSGAINYFTTAVAANFTLNFRGNSTTTLDTVMATGESLTASVMVTNGATAYYANVVQIDGVTITPKWAGGTAPTSGDANSINIYTFTIIKTGTSTYTVLGSKSKFV